jgi:polyisoprenoid-binding protein YceI
VLPSLKHVRRDGLEPNSQSRSSRGGIVVAIGTIMLGRAVILVAVVATMAPGVVRAQSKPIDVQHSRLIVFVGKAGVFSAFGDDHMIGAPISSGTISESGPLSIQLAVNAADLAVLDRDIDSGQREAIRARMIGKDVLDATRFPSITFESTSIEPAGQDRWNVAGSLTVHGTTRRVTFSVVRSNDRYRGDARIRQSDFGIAPIRIAGGTVKVKDELKIEFEIAASPTDGDQSCAQADR